MTATQRARKLARYLADKHHITLKHTHALDAIAQIEGLRNRHIPSAHPLTLIEGPGGEVWAKMLDVDGDISFQTANAIAHSHGYQLHQQVFDAQDVIATLWPHWSEETQANFLLSGNFERLYKAWNPIFPNATLVSKSQTEDGDLIAAWALRL